MSINETDYQRFLSGYTTALYWSSSDTVDGEDVTLDQYPTSTQADDHCRAACLAFFTANMGDVYSAATAYKSPDHDGLELAGHDFALTRNGHGAGFWDGDLPDDLGARLTEASKVAGECWPYLGDDGTVYIQ